MSVYSAEADWSINAVCEDSVLVEWPHNVNEAINSELTATISAITHYLLDHHTEEIINVTPAYRTVLIQFDILTTDQHQITKLIANLLERHLKIDVDTGALHQIPVFYDSSVAADLDKVCFDKNITRDQFVELHASVIYDVYAVGFLPGFAYLGYLPEQLNTPRHDSFRGTVAAGSVAIADRQTAVYPAESPGGWQVIGRTPKQLLTNYQSLLQTGDRVQFFSIERDEFLVLGGVI